jgi:hypothetical protein
MACVSSRIHRGKTVRSCLGFVRAVGALLLFATLASGGVAHAQGAAEGARQAALPTTSVVIFADREMQDREWTALFDALRKSRMEAMVETHAIDGPYELVRGDRMELGREVQTPIVVYLHGDCRLTALPRRTAYGVALGWVLQVKGRIEPFAHVDCTQIGGVLGAQAQSMDADERNVAMAGAIARVIVHEWIHIAAQSSSHAERSIEKAQFGVADLMDWGSEPVARLRNP